MARLIDADKLMAAFKQYMVQHHDAVKCASEDNCKVCGKGCLWRKVVSKAPTVDAAPVVHGKWIVKEHSAPYGGYHLFHCSKCDEPNARERNYCPNCGALMDLED